jgi:hypothetical protein
MLSVRSFLLAIIHKFPNNMMVTAIMLAKDQATISETCSASALPNLDGVTRANAMKISRLSDGDGKLEHFPL